MSSPNPLDVRLPDLPTAGYATKAERELTDAIMFLIRGFERERRLLLEVVTHGRDAWRKRFKQGFRAIHADDEMADAIFGYFVLLAGPNPHEQILTLDQQAEQTRQLQWDYRQRTRTQFAKIRQNLQRELATERRKKAAKKTVYFS